MSFRLRLDGNVVRVFFPRKPLKRWGEDQEGECHRHKDKSYTVRVLATLPPRKKRETLIHELLHASQWSLDEEYVEETARVIEEALNKAGL